MSARSCDSDVFVGGDDFLDVFSWVGCTRLQSGSAFTLKNLFCVLLARKHGIAPGRSLLRAWTEGWHEPPPAAILPGDLLHFGWV